MAVKGTLYGIGVGPGDTELLTLKAVRVLNEVQVIAYPVPNSAESLSRRIVAPLLPEGVTEMPLAVPMNRDRQAAERAYDEAASLLAAHLERGRSVAVLCEGDPFFYGTFMYLFSRLASSYETSVVPGITSLTACAAALGRPLAARNDVLKVIPALLPDDRLKAELRDADSAAIIKVGSSFTRVRQILRDLGIADRAAIVEHATQGDERVRRIEDVHEGDVSYFSTILLYRGSESWI